MLEIAQKLSCRTVLRNAALIVGVISVAGFATSCVPPAPPPPPPQPYIAPPPPPPPPPPRMVPYRGERG